MQIALSHFFPFSAFADCDESFIVSFAEMCDGGGAADVLGAQVA